MLLVRRDASVFLKLIQCGFELGLNLLGLGLRFPEAGADISENGIDFLEIGGTGAFELQFELAHNSSFSSCFQKLCVCVLRNRVIQNEPVIFGKTFDGEFFVECHNRLEDSIEKTSYCDGMPDRKSYFCSFL